MIERLGIKIGSLVTELKEIKVWSKRKLSHHALFSKHDLQIVTPTVCPWIYFVRPFDFILALRWNDYLGFIWNIQQTNNIFNFVHQLFIKYLIPIQYSLFFMTGNHKCPVHKENKPVCYIEAHFCLVNKFYS